MINKSGGYVFLLYMSVKQKNIKISNKNLWIIKEVKFVKEEKKKIIILLKKQIKEVFEKGIEYYLSKDFYNARRCFIEVLKEYQNDKAAKEYLILCDEYYKVKDKRKIETYLETFWKLAFKHIFLTIDSVKINYLIVRKFFYKKWYFTTM